MGKARLRAEACRLAAHRRNVSELEAARYITKGELRHTLTEYSAAEEAASILDLISAVTAKTAVDFREAIISLASSRALDLRARAELYFAQGKKEESARARCASFEAKHISEMFELLKPAVKA